MENVPEEYKDYVVRALALENLWYDYHMNVHITMNSDNTWSFTIQKEGQNPNLPTIINFLSDDTYGSPEEALREGLNKAYEML